MENFRDIFSFGWIENLEIPGPVKSYDILEKIPRPKSRKSLNPDDQDLILKISIKSRENPV